MPANLTEFIVNAYVELRKESREFTSGKFSFLKRLFLNQTNFSPFTTFHSTPRLGRGQVETGRYGDAGRCAGGNATGRNVKGLVEGD